VWLSNESFGLIIKVGVAMVELLLWTVFWGLGQNAFLEYKGTEIFRGKQLLLIKVWLANPLFISNIMTRH
jgi:hypothetical protein